MLSYLNVLLRDVFYVYVEWVWLTHIHDGVMKKYIHVVNIIPADYLSRRRGSERQVRAQVYGPNNAIL